MVRGLTAVAGLLLSLTGCSQAPEQQTPPPTPVSAPTWEGGPTAPSEMDDSPRVMYSLDADRALLGPNDREVTPTLSLRCADGKLAAIVRTHMPPDPSIVMGEPVEGFVAMRVRWDDAKPNMEIWAPSTDGETVFSPEARAFLDRLVNAQTLRMEFRPYRAGSQVMRFNVGGFGATRADALLEQCSER